jgi:hypothetical protein
VGRKNAGVAGPTGANGTTLAAQQYTCSAQSVASLAPLSFSTSIGFGTSIQTTGSLFSSFLLTQPGVYQFDFRVRFSPPPSLVDLTIEDGVVLQINGTPSNISTVSTWGPFVTTVGNQEYWLNWPYLIQITQPNTTVSLINNAAYTNYYGPIPPPYSGTDLNAYGGDCILIITQLH